MPDNGWWNLTVATSSAAQASNGTYVYNLQVQMLDITQSSWSNFKVRALSPGNIAIGPQTVVFAFSVPLFSDAELNIIKDRISNGYIAVQGQGISEA